MHRGKVLHREPDEVDDPGKDLIAGGEGERETSRGGVEILGGVEEGVYPETEVLGSPFNLRDSGRSSAFS